MKKLLGITVALSVLAIVLGGCKTGMEMHEHEFASEWTSDATHHWHSATCEHTEEVSGKAEHAWDDGVITTAATCTEDGVKTYTCTVCKKTKTEAVKKTDHKWDSGTVITAATCTTDGVKTDTCTVCKQTKTEKIPAGHSWNTLVEVKATAFAYGNKKVKCRVCNEEKTETIKMLDVVSLNTLGALKVLQESELASYGITDSSVPAKIAGATYVTFGVYPQTIMASGITVADGTAGVNNGTAIKNTEITGADYYLGSDGNWYAKAKEQANNSGYKYSDDTEVKQSSANSEKYFKVEPIVWRVLKDVDGKYMLLAEKLLTANVAYYGSTSNRTLSGTTVYANNYKYSNIRAWLNGTNNQFVTDGGTATAYDIDWSGKGFLQQVFTTTLQSKIAETTVDNSAASTTDTNNTFQPAYNLACDNTTDRIFLLSVKEATTAEYGFRAYYASGSGKNRIRKPTDYAKANNCYTNENSNAASGGQWWLRSPYYAYSGNARDFDYDGYAIDNGNGVYGTSDGVLPALFVTK